ncbi:hypothetical protein D3C85_1535520 [compost metagenome]
MLQVGQPGGFDVQHQVRPRLVVDRITGVNILGIHQHHGAGADLKRRLLMQVSAAPCGDRTDGKVLVGMPGVAYVATVGDGAGLDEGQGVITPEVRGFIGVFGSSELHRQCPRQVSSGVY